MVEIVEDFSKFNLTSFLNLFCFSIRLGNFLRVYPSARAAFLVYILVLHLWVAFVLLYYEPEVHGPDFHHGGGGGGGENSANNPSNPLDLVPKGA